MNNIQNIYRIIMMENYLSLEILEKYVQLKIVITLL